MVVASLRAAAVAALVLAASTSQVQAQVNHGANVLRYNNPLNQGGMYNNNSVLRYNNPMNQVGMYDNSAVLRYNSPTNQVGMYGNGFTGTNLTPSQVNYGATNPGVVYNGQTGFGGAVTNNVGGNPFRIPMAVSGVGNFGGFGGNPMMFQNNGFGGGSNFGNGFNGFNGGFNNPDMIPGGFAGQPGFNNIAPGPRTAGQGRGQGQGQGIVGGGQFDPDAASVINGTPTGLKSKTKANVRRKTTGRRH